MKKIFLNVKPFIKYFGVFLFFLFWNLIIQPINLDEIWNYGFAHNIYSGLIPYKDFNMVITPLYPMIMAIPFYIFGSNIVVMHIFNSLMITMMFYIIEKLLKKDIGLFLLLLCFPLSVAFPSYNLFLLFLFILLIWLEKSKKNDYLIGVILGLLILTKHSVGICVALPSIYYLFKDKGKFFRRVISCLGVGLLFIGYLVWSGSLINFIDLGILGLFDFAESNSSGFNIILLISMLLFILNIVLIIKNKDNLYYYYLLSFFSLLVPLFDLYHLELYIVAFVFVYLLEKKNEYRMKLFNGKLFVWGIFVGAVLINAKYRFEEKVYFPNSINHFEYRAVTKSYLDYTTTINEKIRKYNEKDIVFLSADGYYFRLINDMPIGYIDLINSGNWGYNGSTKLLGYVKKNADTIIFLDETEIGTNKQTDQNVLKYVVDNGKVIDEVGHYKIYVLGGTDE